MPDYLIKDIDPELWRRFKAKVARETGPDGEPMTMKAKILEWIREFVKR